MLCACPPALDPLSVSSGVFMGSGRKRGLCWHVAVSPGGSMPPSPGAWGPLCNWPGWLQFWNTAHVSSQPRVNPSSSAFQKVSRLPLISAMNFVRQRLPPRPGPASRCGGLALPLRGETARLFPPAPLILTKRSSCSPLPDGAFAAHSPCPGEPQAGNAVSSSPSSLPFFWTGCLHQGWQVGTHSGCWEHHSWYLSPEERTG